MAIGFQRSASQALSHVGLVVAPRRRGGGRLLALAAVLVSLVAGTGLGWFGRDRVMPPPPSAVVAVPDIAALRRELDQAQMRLRVSEARSQELERQVDALNQKLVASQDELTFFRKAREGRR
jgi:uncharacterized protein HemX